MARDTHPINNGNCMTDPERGHYKVLSPLLLGRGWAPQPGWPGSSSSSSPLLGAGLGGGEGGEMGAPVRVVSSGSSPGYQTPPGWTIWPSAVVFLDIGGFLLSRPGQL